MIPGDYRTRERTMTTGEVREYLQKHFTREEYFYTSNNERFRRNLYDVYLGGLDMEKFPRLFKRAIPFRMNIRLEDFVKEYIDDSELLSELENIQLDDIRLNVVVHITIQSAASAVAKLYFVAKQQNVLFCTQRC